MEKSNVFLLSILVMAASLVSISHSLKIFGLEIDQLYVQGTATCSLNGDPEAPPLSNAVVNFTCGGSNSTLGEGLTNPVGMFTILINTISTILVDPSLCIVSINLPTGTCDIYPPDGVIVAGLNFTGFTITSLLTVANYATGAFLNPSID